MKIRIILSFLLFNGALFLYAQDKLYQFQPINILHYQFYLQLEDTTDVIQGKSTLTIEALDNLTQCRLDLTAPQQNTGMTVSSVKLNQAVISFRQSGEKLMLSWQIPITRGDTFQLEIQYQGVPSDGLIIENSKYGRRTFFGDNWPNRAHHWLPTIDHPADKASVEFMVNCPEKYQVVATGKKIEETNIPLGRKQFHYHTATELPTKVMVIGVAEFAVQYIGEIAGIQVSSWVYPDDRNEGFNEYAIGLPILEYFVNKMGSYPNDKLANVQSKTRYGGMENAGNIFYFERSVNGKMDDDELFAHEIAHQWFGNSASELSWYHVWLSEGFATYLTDLYIEDVKGHEAFQKTLKAQRENVINYYQRAPAPLVDTSITTVQAVLNGNAYQKGAWLLHMLRQELGDELFWKGIKAYYDRYRFSNALSEDFQAIVEQISGADLDDFFQQWLYQPGFPVLAFSWDQPKKRKITFQIEQHQNPLFRFPLTIRLVDNQGNYHDQTVKVNQKLQNFTLKVKGKISEIQLDPDVQLLFQIQPSLN